MLCRARWKSSFIIEVATLGKCNVIIIIIILIQIMYFDMKLYDSWTHTECQEENEDYSNTVSMCK